MRQGRNLVEIEREPGFAVFAVRDGVIQYRESNLLSRRQAEDFKRTSLKGGSGYYHVLNITLEVFQVDSDGEPIKKLKKKEF